MDLSRFLVPILPLAFYVMAGGCEAFVDLLTERKGFVTGIAATSAVLVLYMGLNVRTEMESVKSWHAHSIDSIGLLREYAAEWRSVANFIGRISEPSDSIATTAAGIIPYYTRLYTIDQLGLVAKDLRDYRPRDSSMPGHGVVASGPLLIRLHPQFLLGHPTVVDEVQELRASLMIERGWVTRVTSGYKIVGAQSSTTPPRYFALAVRPDVLGRPRRH